MIAPDLPGHGNSDKPRAGYSVAAYANGIRDLLGGLDLDRATPVGHSPGGGGGMQFVLVGSGGAGPTSPRCCRR